MAAHQSSRILQLLETLSNHGDGEGLQVLADAVGMPKSGAHRLLQELIALGYVRQDSGSSRYALTTRLASIALRHLAQCGASDLVQPTLNHLAEQSGELVRLAVVDGERLIYVFKAQGARSGLRYDPDMGGEAPLYCTATGHTWLASMDPDRALQIVAKQGLQEPETRGPDAPKTFAEVMERVAAARERGYGRVIECSSPGMSALAAVVSNPRTGIANGVLSIGGPSARLTPDAMNTLAPALLAAANDLTQADALSAYAGQVVT